MPPKQKRVTLGQIRTDLNCCRRGDLAEQYVTLIATWKGAEVFPNVNNTGKSDLIIIPNGFDPVQIDVKLGSWNKNGEGRYRWSCREAYNVELPVYPLIGIPEGDIMNWTIKWKRTSHKSSPFHCPPGLETFWDKPSTTV